MAAALIKSFIPCRTFSVFLRSPLVCAKKTVEDAWLEKAGIEEPKAPPRPYSLYLKDNLARLNEVYPELTGAQRIKKLQTSWRELPKPEKEKYNLSYKVLHKKYFDDMYEYYQKVNKLPLALGACVSMKKNVLKSWKMKLGKPKRPESAFMKFVRDYARESGKHFRVIPGVVEGKKKWEQLSQAERDKLCMEAKRKWDKYQEELLQWEKKMFEDGHVLLIRSRSLKQIKNLTN